MIVQPSEWKGSNPFCLLIVDESEAVTLIDLDAPGWVTTHQGLMRTPGRWILARKAGSVPVLVLTVVEGEQPYYTSRVFRPFAPVPNCPKCGATLDWESVAAYRAYGIGKKRTDSHVDRLWVLPNSTICGGDDVDRLGHEAMKVATQEVWRTHYASHKLGSEEQEGRRSGREEGGERRREAGRGRSGDSGPAVRQSARSRAAHRRAEQRPAP